MVQVEKIETNGVPLYVVGGIPSNWNNFTEWLYKLEDEEMSLSFLGHMYRFRTPEERIQFVFGFTKAWELIDDAYVNKCYGETK